MIGIKTIGLDRLIAKFDQAAKTFANAREYALASTAKMVRNTAKNSARYRGMKGVGAGESNTLGWPSLSPFTGTISKSHMAVRGAFQFAKQAVSGLGWRKARDTYSGRISRVMEKQLRRQIRFATGGKVRPPRPVRMSLRSQPMAKLINFVRSRLDEAAGRVMIGFYRNQGDGSTDTELEANVKAQAEGRFLMGSTTTVSEKMRRFLFAIGFPTAAREFKLPKRPWFGPVFQMVREAIPNHFAKKFLARFGSAFAGNPLSEAI